MAEAISERDWKYIRSIQDELLSSLCARINREAQAILLDPQSSDHEKYLELYRHVKESDGIIADCFDDWRRSTILIKIFLLREQGLLSEDHMRNLSQETGNRIRKFETEF